uniref:hypothetical protein n=1 Tax=Methylobacterium sp. B34 TaxID=95563 RepID=UPI000349CF43|nr:hypothetical protein [Methylobacterium sp. B34]
MGVKAETLNAYRALQQHYGEVWTQDLYSAVMAWVVTEGLFTGPEIAALIDPTTWISLIDAYREAA